MKKEIGKLFGIAAFIAFSTVLVLGGCKQTSDDDAATVDLGVLINGSSDDDGAKTATFADGVSKVDDVDGKPYLFTGLSGAGKFEVKSAADWDLNITDTTMSVMESGNDKIGKIQLELVGTAQNYEVAYNIGDPKNISASVFSVKMYIPPVYADAAAVAYPVLSFSVKNSSWSTFPFAKINTFLTGSGWKTIAIDFVNKTLTVDGAAIAAVDCDLLDFSSANMGGLTDAKLVVMGFYGDALPSTMTEAFYIDYLDISGFADPVLAAPSISCAANAGLTAFEVTIAGPAGSAVWYTTDGTTAPAASGSGSTLYTAPFAITADTTVKAIAVQTGFANSPVVSQVCVYVNPVSDTTVDPVGTTFGFTSNITGANDDGSDYGVLGSRFSWLLETPAGSDGVLVIEGAATAPTAAVKSVFTISLPAPIASPASISIKIRVPAGMAADWFQSFKISARLTDGWTTRSSADIKFPASSFAADTWKVITLNAADFTGGSLADLRAITFDMYRDFAGGATSLDDVQIDWITVQ